MRNIVEFRTLGKVGSEFVVALSNDGRLYMVGAKVLGAVWMPFPQLPQDGFDPAETFEALKTAPFAQAFERLVKTFPFGGAAVDPECPVHGSIVICGVEGCSNPGPFCDGEGKNPRCAVHAFDDEGAVPNGPDDGGSEDNR